MWNIEDKLHYELNYQILPESTRDVIVEAIDYIERCNKSDEHLYEQFCNALDKIADLSKKIKNLKKKTEWISVEKELPKKEGEYLVFYNGYILPADFRFDSSSGYFHIYNEYGDKQPTHWMPLPKAPKITKKKETIK